MAVSCLSPVSIQTCRHVSHHDVWGLPFVPEPGERRGCELVLAFMSASMSDTHQRVCNMVLQHTFLSARSHDVIFWLVSKGA
jgi:hypothetical protein